AEKARTARASGERPAGGGSPHAKDAATDAILVRGAARHREARRAGEEAEVQRVIARREVGLEPDLMIIDEDVARLPQSHRGTPLEHGMVAVVTALEAVDVDEHLPVFRYRTVNAEIRPQMVDPLGDHARHL